MLDELAERVIPWGGLGALGVVAGSLFPDETRKLAKVLLRGAMRAGTVATALAAEAYEKSQDLVAEARAEEAESQRRSAPSELRVVKARPQRARQSTARARTRSTSGPA